MSTQGFAVTAVAGIEGNISIAADKERVACHAIKRNLSAARKRDLCEIVVRQAQRDAAGRIGWEVRCGIAIGRIETRRTIGNECQRLVVQVVVGCIKQLSEIVGDSDLQDNGTVFYNRFNGVGKSGPVRVCAHIQAIGRRVDLYRKIGSTPTIQDAVRRPHVDPSIRKRAGPCHRLRSKVADRERLLGGREGATDRPPERDTGLRRYGERSDTCRRPSLLDVANPVGIKIVGSRDPGAARRPVIGARGAVQRERPVRHSRGIRPSNA